jgi:hypothetical protein
MWCLDRWLAHTPQSKCRVRRRRLGYRPAVVRWWRTIVRSAMGHLSLPSCSHHLLRMDRES